MRALAIACAMVPLVGCRQLLSSDSYQFVEDDASVGTGMQEGGAEEGGDDGGCKLARPLERKITAEVGGMNELVFVTHNVDIGETQGNDGTYGYLKLGYDLDDRCGGRRCRNPLDTNPEARDGINGIDDAMGRMIANIKLTFDTEIVSTALVNQETADAQLPPLALFRIRNYDGLQDDNHVDVDWFVPVLPGSGDDGGTSVDAGAPAKWDGTDVWSVEPSTFVQPASADGKTPGGKVLERISSEAYVTSYHLIAKFPDGIPFRLWLFGAPLYTPVVTADLFPNTQTKKFELRSGIISGRSAMRDVLALIPVMTQALPTAQALCSDSPLYPTISDFICTYPDLTSANGDGSDCDMMSVAIGFDAVPAKVGGVALVTPPQPLCPPEFDPSKQKCFPAPDGGADP